MNMIGKQVLKGSVDNLSNKLRDSNANQVNVKSLLINFIFTVTIKKDRLEQLQLSPLLECHPLQPRRARRPAREKKSC